jgi:hypothetical protein
LKSEILRIIYFLIILIGSALFILNPNPCSAERITIKKVKALNLTTSLVEKGKAQAIIVAPSGGRYQTEAAHVREQVRKLSSVDLPIYLDDIMPAELLRQHHVIALGNMTTNAFIETLYRQWQVILDLKYPGAGGYVVRSLHNPYGSGHNVIFLGGSDDAGVNEATRIFTGELKGDADAVSVGWLMKVRLGKGLAPAAIGAHLQKWDVQSWNDSRRTASDGAKTGYDPVTYFGWNPISIAGTLYYMTGQKEYFDTFKQLAIPNLQKLPLANRSSEAFTDPANPLVKSDHYRAHMVDCIFDLIEESPLFSDDERLFITNKLLEHQGELDPTDTFSIPNGDRHALWHMVSIYTGSRYFAWSYPNPRWDKRMANARKGFNSFINNPSWSDDTLEWISTYLEPIFDFFLLDGPENFMQSRTAQIMMKGLEVLMTGDEVDDYNKSIPICLLHKASYLLKDGRYSWMLRRLGFDLDIFRIGQSYWPATVPESTPPADLVNRITVAPLANANRNMAQTPVTGHEGFQLLSYRSGLEKTDDYFLLDGFEGLGRHPYQVNTLTRLRMFKGKNILSGYANDLNIWRNGVTDAHVARGAALRQKLAAKDVAYIHTEVPDTPASIWQRRVVYLKDRCAIVVDRVTAGKEGRFDIVNSWQVGSNIKAVGKPTRRVILGNGAGLVSADIPFEQISDSIVQAKVSRELSADESVALATLFFDNARPKAISALKPGGYLLSGKQSAFVRVGPYRSPAFSISADFVYIDRDLLLLAGATELTLQGTTVFHSDRPVTILWDLKAASATVSASEAARIQLVASGQAIDTVVQPSERVIASAVPQEDLPGRIDSILAAMETETINPEKEHDKASKPLPAWQPEWETTLDGKVTAIAELDTPLDKGKWFWAVSQQDRASTITRIAADGKQLNKIQHDGEVLSIWPGKGEKQTQAFGLLAGFKDDMLRAFSRDGKEMWSVKAAIHPSFMIGDHYDAPWFTDPRPPFNMTGVYSVLAGDFWGKGKEEIAIGRPCTVEFYDLNGRLNARAPTRWGNNTALAIQQNPGGYGKDPILLAGKAYTGSPQLSGINKTYSNISDNLFGEIAPGFTNMHAWLQRGLSGLRVADINNDGSDEVIFTLSGHWNELRAYSGSGKILWMKSFGPDKGGGAPFMSAIEVSDLNGDGRKEIIVATKKGWVIAFDHLGNQLWGKSFDSGVTSLSTNENHRLLAAGCEDGALVLLDAAGRQVAGGDMKAAVTSVVFSDNGVTAGSAKGIVGHFDLPR